MAHKMDEDSHNFMWDVIDDTSEGISTGFPIGQKEHGGFILDIGLRRLIKEDKKEKWDGLTYGHGVEILVEKLYNDPLIRKRGKEIGIKW